MSRGKGSREEGGRKIFKLRSSVKDDYVSKLGFEVVKVGGDDICKETVLSTMHGCAQGPLTAVCSWQQSAPTAG